MASASTIYRPSIMDLRRFIFGAPSRCLQILPRTRPSSSIHPIAQQARPGHASAHRLQHFSTNFPRLSIRNSRAPSLTASRGPESKEDTQTDFGVLDVLSHTPAPSTSIDASVSDGFHLNSGVKVTGGAGVLLVGGEAFAWRPWTARAGASSSGPRLLNDNGQWEVDEEAWGLLKLVWPKPDLLILGLGPSMLPLSPKTRQSLSDLGIRLDIQDTRNAASQFNLLATERGTENVAAAIIPFGFVEGKGCVSSR